MKIPPLEEMELGSGRLKFRFGGRGPLLVIIHGLAGHSEHFTFQFREFGDRFRILAPDFRGQGVSPAGCGPLGLVPGVRDLEEVLEKLDLADEKFVLLGHSLGGMMAQEFALGHKEKIKKLILVCTAARSNLGLPMEFMRLFATPLLPRIKIPDWIPPLVIKSQLFLLGKPDAEVLEWINGIQENYGPEVLGAMVEYYKSVGGWDVRSRLKSLDMPLLVVWGSRDPVIPRPFVRELIRGLPNPETVRICPSGHNPHFENYKDFNKALSQFVEC